MQDGDQMKTSKWARLLLGAAPLLGGCGNFWQSPNSGNNNNKGGCTTNCTHNTVSGNFYIANQAISEIAAYNITNGKLTKISGSPYTMSAKPVAIAVSPNGGSLYVSTAAGIFLYTIDSTTGALALGNNSRVISTDYATTMQVDGNSSWLVEAGPTLAEIIAIPLDPSTGLMGTGGEQHATLPATSVHQLAVSPDNGRVFITLGANGTVEMPFQSSSADPFQASLGITIPVKNTGGEALSVAVDPDNRVFYIGETLANAAANSGGLRVFNYASLTSTLAESPGSPYASGGLAPNAILPATGGTYTYVANGKGATSAGVISGFSIQVSQSAYSLTALSGATAAGIAPAGLAEENTGKYVLLIDSGGTPDLEAFTFDSTTAGKLDSAFTASTGTDPVDAVSLAAAPQ